MLLSLLLATIVAPNSVCAPPPLLQNGRGMKMEYPHISALIYALGIGLGFATFPLVPPDQEVMMGAKH